MQPAVSGRLIAGRYRLGSVIGHGGMGVVWRADDELLSREVAVKELIWPPDYSEQERQTAYRRTTREAQTAARLNHPNIIRIYDIVEEDGHPWIVMELLPYRSLRDIVREDGPVTPARAAQVGLGILAALRAAHAEGIVHRDVKPANILVGPDSRAVLTDFGIARASNSPTLTNAGDLIGSPSYIAPERARGERARASGDWWGLGASLYAAVEGHPPFERATALATLTSVVADEPRQAVHAGPLWPLISALLRKDPAARPDDDEIERMLRGVASGETTHVISEQPPTFAAEAAAEPAPEPESAPEPAPEAAAEPAAEPGPASEVGGPPPPDPAPPGPPAPPVQRADRVPRRLWPPRRRVAVPAVLAVLAAAACAAGLVLTGNPGSAGQRSASSPSAGRGSAGPSPSVTPGGTNRATSSPGTGSGTASAGTPQPSASSSGQPAASPGSQNTGYGALPAGFYRFTNSTGFSIGVPQGWQIQHVGHYVYVRDPSNSGIFLLIDQSDQPKLDPLADWEQQAANRASSYPDYHLIRLASVNYPQAEKAADWEFTYDRDGVIVQVLNRNVLANAQHAYALYWSVPESEWNAYYHYFEAFASTFVPAPAT